MKASLLASPCDRLTEMQDRIDDYLSFGVRYVWLINPRTRQAYVYTSAGIRGVGRVGGILPLWRSRWW